MVDTIYGSTSKGYDEQLNLFNIHSLRESYQKLIINNTIIVEAFKDMKRKYKNA